MILLLAIPGIVIACALVVIFFTKLNDDTAKKVNDTSIMYAKNDCIKRDIPKSTCENLTSEIDPPPTMGRDSWIVRVFSQDDAKSFNSSMEIKLEGSKPVVYDYIFYNQQDL